MIISLIGRIFLYAAIIRLMGGVFLFCRIVRGFFAFASGISFTFGIPVRLVSFICIIFLGTVFFGLAFILSISPMISLIRILFLGFAAFLAAAIVGWIGFSVYARVQENKPVTYTEVNMDAVNEYMDTLN